MKYCPAMLGLDIVNRHRYPIFESEHDAVTAEHPLDRVIDALAARFPDLGRDTVADCVIATHARLQQNATIDSHLTTLTQRQAGDELARHPQL